MVNTLILNFQLPELRENTFPLFLSHPVCGACFVMAATGDCHTRLALLPGTPLCLVPSSKPSHHLQSHHLLHEPELSVISLCNLMLSPCPTDL